MTHDGATTISRTFDRVLDSEPGRVALIGSARQLTYEQLDRAADAAAAALRELGVGRGDRVAASLPNDVDIVVAFHGAMRLGAIWVGVNRALAPSEKEVLLAASMPTILLADPEIAALHRESCHTVAVDPDQPDSEWMAALHACDGAARPADPDPDAPAGIAFTSGTTGEPKGIVHSQRNLLLPAISLVVSRGYDRELRKGDCLPLTILNLQVLTTLLTSAAGGCCVLTDRRDARGVAEWLRRESVTVWNGVPALLYSMVHDDDIDASHFRTLREVWTGGAPCPEDLYQGFEKRFGVALRQTYGLTEAPTVVTMEALDDLHVPEASGRVLPHLELRIAADDGATLGSGELGEVVVSGVHDGPWAGDYTPLLGYWRDGSVEPFGEEELHTGDIGIVDEAGNLFVRDRKKLLIIRGGANVYPAEVERVLDQAPGVRASAVVGLPDPRLGQRVVAAIEVNSGDFHDVDEVVAHCRAYLARYKVPEEIIVVEELPRNAMAKVQRPLVVELFT